jgi:diguanylate cyclase (GGDEF)-like protein
MNKIENEIKQESTDISQSGNEISTEPNNDVQEKIVPEYIKDLQRKFDEAENPFVKQRREHDLNLFKEIFESHFATYEKAYKEALPATSLSSNQIQEIFITKELEHIKNLVEMERENRNIYSKDKITELFNEKIKLEDRYKFEIEALKNSENNDKATVLFFIDLNDFKIINDKKGHDVGDLVLKEVALALQKVTRTRDLIVRQGGDEFSIILGQVKKDKIDEKLKDIERNLSTIRYSNDPKDPNNKTEEISLSLGVRVITAEDVQKETEGQGILKFQDAYKQADQASIVAKQRVLLNPEHKTVLFKYGDENKLEKNLDWCEQWSVKQNMRNLSDLNKKRSEKYKKLEEMKKTGIDTTSQEPQIKEIVEKIENCIKQYTKEIETRIKIYKALGRRDYNFEQESKTCD